MPIDGQREGRWIYDERAADRVVGFFEHFLVHTKGRKFAGEPVILEEWQRDRLICPAFGWKDAETGLRRYQNIWLEIPRKNGKSTIGAGVSLYLLVEGEPGAEVYSAAGSKQQARAIFDQAIQMVKASPALSRILDTQVSSITYNATGVGVCTYRVLAADAKKQHGLNPSGVVFDEIHVQPNSKLWTALEDGMSARDQPMFWCFTTAGETESGFAYEQHEYAASVAKDPSIDERYLSVIYAAKPEDRARFDDPEVWRAANPNLGITIPLERFERMAARARKLPSRRIEFCVYYLNIWTQGAEEWIELPYWDACVDAFSLDDMDGRDVYIAVDMSKRRDISSVALVFPPTEEEVAAGYDRARLHLEMFVPLKDLDERENNDKQPYRAYVEGGWLNGIPGAIIRQSRIERYILDVVNKRFNILEAAVDPYQANRLREILEDEDVVVFEHSQRASMMNEPTKDYEEAVIECRLAHCGNPLMRWMMGNVRLTMDSSENVKPSKVDSTGRIDGPVSAIMAYGRYAQSLPDKGYDEDDFDEV